MIMQKTTLPHAFVWVFTIFLTLLELVRGFTSYSPSASFANGAPPSSSSSLMSTAAVSGPKEGNQGTNSRLRRRDRFLKVLGFRRLSQDHRTIREIHPNPPPIDDIRYRITSEDEIDAYFDDEQQLFRKEDGEINHRALLKALDVRGDTQIIGDVNRPDYVHPVARILHERKRNAAESTSESSNKRSDGAKIALAIEGGGMRGCVSAGMICAIHHLNLTSSFDVVYGSSAGSIVGSYLITGQLPWFGPEVYYDRLTTAGKDFIDTRRLLRALGFGLLDPRLYKDVLTRPKHGKPVLNLPFLLKTTMQETKPLDWGKLVEMQKKIPLKVVVSDLKAEKSLALDMEGGYFNSLSELTDCMHASCLLPGIAGPVMNLDRRAIGKRSPLRKYVLGDNVKGSEYRPMADALIYEPLPFRSALADGATHVVVVRSRPDGVDVTGKGSVFENLIFRRFFLRKNRLPRIFHRMKRQLHKGQYAKDVLRLNKEAYSERHYRDTSSPHLLAVAAPPGSPEVTRLETGREAIFEGLRRGFARAYDCLVENPAERGRGVIVAKEYFPDQILDYDPLSIDSREESAFEYYLRTMESDHPQVA